MEEKDKQYLSWSDGLNPGSKPQDRRITDVPKLLDAKKAGGKNSYKCTLIITEGDSAKLLVKSALCALSSEARQFYGVYPLNGKPLNVRREPKKISSNVQFNNLKKILGLQSNSLISMRYGRVMIMADQDPDGSHIKGLLINYFHYCWPDLLKRNPSFLVMFITPVAKAVHNTTNEVQEFYSIYDYDTWNENAAETENWSSKKYKGLGSINSEEAKLYFTRFDKHVKRLVSEGDEKDKEAMELAFSRKRAKARRQKKIQNQLDFSKSEFTISEFVHKELFFYFETNLQRSIPHLTDGLKLCQRSILFNALKNNLIESVTDSIILMAEDYPGTNNINLFQITSQCGTRDKGGNDVPGTRYIEIKLSPTTKLLFPQEDDFLLDYAEEGEREFLPIIPIILLNGCRGVGTGWSSSIPNYNPRVIIHNLKVLIAGETELKDMEPWYRRFMGEIKKKNPVTYVSTGIHAIIGETLVITELPIRSWTQNYKKYLQKDKPVGIQDIEDLSDGSHVMLLLKMPKKEDGSEREQWNDLLDKKMLKLSSNISTKNMYLYNEHSVLKKYDSPEQILKEFYTWRLSIYESRLYQKIEIVQDKLQELNTIINGRRAQPVGNQRKRNKMLEWYGGLDELTSERDKLQEKLQYLKRATPESLWLKDLEALEEELDKIEVLDEVDAHEWREKFTEVTERIFRKIETQKRTTEEEQAEEVERTEEETEESEEVERIEKQAQETEKSEESEENQVENKEGKGEEKQREDDEE